VLTQVSSSVSYANRFGDLGDATAGLVRQVTGASFFGCYLGYPPDPWSGIDRAFFFNTATGVSWPNRSAQSAPIGPRFENVTLPASPSTPVIS
jgi:hypothetical protein